MPLPPTIEPDVPAPVAVAMPLAPPRLAPAAAPPVEATPVPLAAAPPPEPVDEPRREEPVHRHTLIRATLPKIEGQVPERKPADFTLWNVARHPQGRRGPGGGRPRQPQAAGNANWGGYSPYANGHPSGKGPQQGQGGQPGKSRPSNRRGR